MKELFDFTRLAKRGDFWIVQIVTMLLQFMLLSFIQPGVTAGGIAIIILAMLVLAIIALANLVCRIRDTGNNVLWILACFIPYIGLIAWVVFGCLETKESE